MLGILLAGVTGANAFTLADGSSGSLSQTAVNNLAEEYRWNSPVLTYSYDESFLNYFGSNGVAVHGHGYGWHFGVSSLDRRICRGLCMTKSSAPNRSGESRRRFRHQIISVTCAD